MDIYALSRDIATTQLTRFGQKNIYWIKVTKGNGPDHRPGPVTKAAKKKINATTKGVRAEMVDGRSYFASDLFITTTVEEEYSLIDLFEINGIEYKIVADVSTPISIEDRVVNKFLLRVN